MQVNANKKKTTHALCEFDRIIRPTCTTRSVLGRSFGVSKYIHSHTLIHSAALSAARLEREESEKERLRHTTENREPLHRMNVFFLFYFFFLLFVSVCLGHIKQMYNFYTSVLCGIIACTRCVVCISPSCVYRDSYERWIWMMTVL